MVDMNIPGYVQRRWEDRPDSDKLEPPAQISMPENILHYTELNELEKNLKLIELFSELRLNKVIIFVKNESRAEELNNFLVESSFPSICIHSGLSKEESLTRHKDFQERHNKIILVATDVTHVEIIDAYEVNIVINYDMPDSADTFLYRLGAGTKVLLIAFVASAGESRVLNQVPKKFNVNIKELPKHIDISTYDFDMDVLNRDAISDYKYRDTTFEQGDGRGPSLPYCYGAGGVGDDYEELRQYRAAYFYPYGYEVDVVTGLAPYGPYHCVLDKVLTKDCMRHEFDQTAILVKAQDPKRFTLGLELDTSSESKKSKYVDTSENGESSSNGGAFPNITKLAARNSVLSHMNDDLKHKSDVATFIQRISAKKSAYEAEIAERLTVIQPSKIDRKYVTYLQQKVQWLQLTINHLTFAESTIKSTMHHTFTFESDFARLVGGLKT